MSTHDSALKDARDQLSLILSFFPRVDAKLSTILAVDTGMLAALSASLPSLQRVSAWMAITPSLATTLIAVSYVYLYKGGFPDVNGGNASLVYFKQIANRTEAKFIDEYCGVDSDELRRDVLGQVWRNSEILSEKYRCLRLAFICMAVGAIPWIVSLAVFAMARANVQIVVPHS